MQTTSRNLAMRDRATAILMGAMAINATPQRGAAFGDDYGDDYGDEYGDDYGDEYGYEFGDDYGFEFGDDYGAAAPSIARPRPRVRRPVPPPAAMAAVRKLQAQKKITGSRMRLLEPNRGSSVKVERYVFGINAAITLGTAASLTATGQPDTNIRPQRVTMNAPAYGFATVTELKVANVSVTVGGIQDAFDFNANGVGQSLDMPLLTPANRATMLGAYTGFVPPGYVGATAYTFCVSFKGPASIIA